MRYRLDVKNSKSLKQKTRYFKARQKRFQSSANLLDVFIYGLHRMLLHRVLLGTKAFLLVFNLFSVSEFSLPI